MTFSCLEFGSCADASGITIRSFIVSVNHLLKFFFLRDVFTCSLFICFRPSGDEGGGSDDWNLECVS